ncbi:MAG: hypothetical protein KDC33_02165 [Thermoleophilia bacterium]|nr:hypothetical protein [Thermoleophilia bacterium]
MHRRLAPFLAVAALAAAAGCGPAGPNESKGPAADPVAVLHTLPVPSGLRNGVAEHEATAEQVLAATLPDAVPEAVSSRARGAGLGRSGIRTFTHPGGGELSAVIVVWPSHLTADNFGLQLVQTRLGKDGRTAWTPRDLPGSQGARQGEGDRERILVRSVGPNTLVVRGTGAVPDDAVAVTLKRMVEVQDAKGGG